MPRPMGMAGAVCIIAAAACRGSLALPAQAAPATLRSADAAIYEQADEGSNTVGNLVEGSTFDYIGDVTAEDGSVWHQVTTASGAAGYIKGDREIEAVEGPAPEGQSNPEGQGSPEGQNPPGGQGSPEGQANPEDPASPEGQAAPGEGNGDAAPAGDEPGEGGGGAGGNQDGEPAGDAGEEDAGNPEGEDAEDGEGNPEDGESQGLEDNPLEEDALAADTHGVENLQAKSYALDLSGRIKGKEGIVPVMNMDTGETTGRRKEPGIDTTLLLGVAVIFSCAGMAYICWGRIKRIRPRPEGKQPQGGSVNRAHRKDGKKRHSQKRKGRKK